MRNTLVAFLCFTLLTVGCASLRKDGSAAKEPGKASVTLQGTWVLDIIPHPSATLDSLYPGNKPELSFEPAGKKFSGYTGCNCINGPLVSENNTISFRGDIAMTQMACTGEGENVFLENLKKINTYSVSADGKELTLIRGDIALLHFHKK